jgi:acyl-CoA thioesterase
MKYSSKYGEHPDHYTKSGQDTPWHRMDTKNKNYKMYIELALTLFADWNLVQKTMFAQNAKLMSFKVI